MRTVLMRAWPCSLSPIPRATRASEFNPAVQPFRPRALAGAPEPIRLLIIAHLCNGVALGVGLSSDCHGMTWLRVLTVIDQTEQDLLRRIGRGEWKDALPAFKQLAPQLGISVLTLGRAVKQLARRGVLVSQGPRRPFKIDARALPVAAANHAAHAPLGARRHDREGA